SARSGLLITSHVIAARRPVHIISITQWGYAYSPLRPLSTTAEVEHANLSHLLARIRPRTVQAVPGEAARRLWHDPERRRRHGDLARAHRQPGWIVPEGPRRQFLRTAGPSASAHERGDERQRLGRCVPYRPGPEGGCGASGRTRDPGAPRSSEPEERRA